MMPMSRTIRAVVLAASLLQIAAPASAEPVVSDLTNLEKGMEARNACADAAKNMKVPEDRISRLTENPSAQTGMPAFNPVTTMLFVQIRMLCQAVAAQADQPKN